MSVSRQQWSTLTNAPYYKEKFALELKIVLDEMLTILESGHSFVCKVYQYKHFSNYTPSTIYARIIQSKMFLLDKLDPIGKYKLFLENVEIKREPNFGVILSVKKPLEILKE